MGSQLRFAKRILVIGNGGSGKSTFARRLGEKLCLPVFHLDAYYWRSGWVHPTEEEWRAQVKQLVAQPEWVMDGNYTQSLDIRVPRADLIIQLEAPRLICLYRALRRSILYRKRYRADMAPGCPEKFDPEFLKWIWIYDRKRRPRTLQAIERNGGLDKLVIIRGRRKMANLMDAM